jgi:hypothetical protein
MSQFDVHSGIAPHAWLKHHLPWLGLLAVVLSLFRDDPDVGVQRDELNG